MNSQNIMNEGFRRNPMMMCSGAGGSSCSTGTGGSSTSNSGSGYGTHALPPTGNCVKVTRVWIEDTLTLYMGNEYCMEANVYPVTATEQGVRWNSGCPDVVTISSSGKIKAKKEGNATITVITKDGNFSKNCVVVVKKAPVNGSGNSCCGYGCDDWDGTHAIPQPGNCVKVTSVKLLHNQLDIYAGDNEIDMKIGDSITISAQIYPTNATEKGMCWGTSCSDIVEVNQDGGIIAKREGSANVYVITKDGALKSTCKVNVKRVPVTDIIFTSSENVVYENNSIILNVTILPADATDKIEWKSSDTDIATVDNGHVFAKKAGNVIITAKGGANIERTYKLIIKKPIKVTSLKLPKKTYDLLQNNFTKQIAVEILPADATDKGLTWSSSDVNVAIVENNGNIKVKGTGTTVITVKTNDGGYTEKCTINVAGVPFENGKYYIINKASGLALELIKTNAPQQDAMSTSIVEQQEFTGKENQRWALITEANGCYLCPETEIEYKLTDEGSAVKLLEYGGVWGAIPNNDGTYRLLSSKGRVLAMKKGVACGGKCIVTDYSGSDNEKWIVNLVYKDRQYNSEYPYLKKPREGVEDWYYETLNTFPLETRNEVEFDIDYKRISAFRDNIDIYVHEKKTEIEKQKFLETAVDVVLTGASIFLSSITGIGYIITLIDVIMLVTNSADGLDELTKIIGPAITSAKADSDLVKYKVALMRNNPDSGYFIKITNSDGFFWQDVISEEAYSLLMLFMIETVEGNMESKVYKVPEGFTYNWEQILRGEGGASFWG